MRIAAIDIGTNSVHMIVCRIRPDLSFEVIDSEKDMIRLGAGGLEGRRLAEPALVAAMQTLSKFKRLAESHGVDEIIASATSAVREAANGNEFVAKVRRELGIRVRVISGTEEARLIHLAAAYATGVGNRAAVVIDIGGGSAEITLGTARRMQLGRSFKLGVIRMTEKFVTTDPLSRRDERRLTKHIRKETRSYIRQIVRRGYARVIGTSGTILAMGQLAVDSKRALPDIRNVRVDADDLRRVRRKLTSLTLEERLKLPGLDPRRADIAVAGSILIDTMLDELEAEHLWLCDYALREGLILDYIGRNRTHIQTVDRYPDVRRRSIIELGERCQYLPDHAQQVAKISLALFDATRELHGLGDREREWLEYASLLHDIGTFISYERHHKHSQYLITNGDLRGFEPDEVETMALVARYHRQSTPSKSHRDFGALPRARRRTVRALAALLRLAEGLDRSHAQVISKVAARHVDGRLVVHVASTGDSELERWAAGRHAQPLADLLNIQIDIEVAPARRSRNGTSHDQHAEHPARLPGTPVRRRGHRRIRQDDAA